MRRLTWISAAVALIVVLALAWVASEVDAQQGTPPSRFFSGPVIFGPPRVADPFRGRRPAEVPTAGPVGDNINVTGNNAPQNETAIAVNPITPANLVAGANDYRQGDANVGAYTSSNGGATWNPVILNLPGGLSVGANPSTAFDNLQNAYVAGIGFNRGGPSGARDGTVLVWKSQFGNFTGSEDAAVVAQGSENVFHDKPYIGTGDVDADATDDVFVSWTEFTTQGPTLGFPIRFSRSVDGGVNWSAPVRVSDGDATQGSVPVKAGNAVYVVFYDFGANLSIRSDDFIKLDKSTDGGATWGTDVPVASVVEIPSPLPGWGFRTNSFPSIGASPSGGDLYVVYASDPAGTDAADVFFRRSTNGGSTWSPPVRLNDGAETNAHQFFPGLAVGPDGVIHVVWYDTRGVGGSATNEEINLFYTSSSDGGDTWSANERVSPRGFVPNSGDQFGGGFIGDYNGIAATPAAAHPVWTGYQGQDQDIFHATISGVPNDPLTSRSTTNTGLATRDPALDDPAVIEAVAKSTVTALTASPAITPAGFKVAFIGDSEAGSDFRNVLELIRDEGTDMVMHQGDLGYGASASTWDQVVTDVLGADFPYFASKGNHDSWSSYQQVLSARLALVPGASCSGDPSDLGIQSSCTYQGLFFILSGVGEASGPIAHDTYIRQQLAQDNSTWSVCSWHKNQNAMQVGGKGNSTGWGVYEECRIGGAMVATGHEHSYSRTRTLTSTSSQIVDAEWPQADETRLAEGSTVVFVSGLGGRSIRNQDRCSPSTFPYGCNGEWASIYTSDQGADYGALFCSFHVDGQPNKAHCYFKDVSGKVPDSFNVTSFLGAGLGSPPVATPDSATTNEDTPVATDVLFNDSDPDPGDTLLLLSFDSASANGGVVTRLDNGTPGDTSDDDLLYTPAQDFNGVDSYGYDVSDGAFTTSALVTVTVDPIEDPPVAVDDPDFTPIDIPVTTDVLANDSDPDGDTVLLQSFDAVSANAGSIALDDRGTATASDDRLIYSPPLSFEGVDSYTYTISDGVLSDTATVTITVADNQPPLAVDDPETTAINTAVTTDVLANDSEPEGDPLFLDSFDAASTQGGTVSRDEGGTPGSTGDDQLVYTPPTDFVGVDTYGYTVADDKGGFASATVTVNVLAPDIVFERRVSTGNDDAEQSSSGSVNLSSSDLELVQESSTQTIGIRFQNVNVPPEATIVKAWVQLPMNRTPEGRP